MSMKTMSAKGKAALECFSELLIYPAREATELKGVAAELLRHLEGTEPGAREAAAGVGVFLDHVSGLSRETLEETYTATFECNPALHLYAGFLLFGESYKRGALLVELKKTLGEHGIPLGTELPDFIPTLLKLLARLPAATQDAEELRAFCLYPAMRKLVEGIKNLDNPYSSLLAAARDFLACKEAYS